MMQQEMRPWWLLPGEEEQEQDPAAQLRPPVARSRFDLPNMEQGAGSVSPAPPLMRAPMGQGPIEVADSGEPPAVTAGLPGSLPGASMAVEAPVPPPDMARGIVGPPKAPPVMPGDASTPTAPPDMDAIGRNPMYRAGLVATKEAQDDQAAPAAQSRFGAGPLAQAHLTAAQKYAELAGKKTPLWQSILQSALTRDLRPLTQNGRLGTAERQVKALGGAAEEERKQQANASGEELKIKQMELLDEEKRNALAARATPKKMPTVEELQAMKFSDGRPVFTPEQITILMGGGKLKQGKEAGKPYIVTKPGDVLRASDDPTKIIATNDPKEAGPTGDFAKIFLPAYAKNLGKEVGQLTPDETMAAFSAHKQFNADPDMKASLLASRAMMNSLHQMQLSQQPTEADAQGVAADMVNHRMAPEQLNILAGSFGAAGAAYKRMVNREVRKLDPNFNYEQASAEYALVKSPGFQNNIRYMDSVVQSIPQVIQAANVLGNGKIKSLNSLMNAGKRQFNSVDLGKFNTDRILVADEIAKLLQGGGTGAGTSDAKLKQAGDIIKESDDPALIASNLGEVSKLLGYRRGALTKGTYFERPEEQHATTQQPQQGGGAAKVKVWNPKTNRFE